MRKKLNPIVTACTAVIVLYAFFAVRPLSKEIHFITKWTTDCNKASPDAGTSDEQEYIPFRLGQTAGYFTQDGKILQSFTFPYKIALSAQDYCTYGTSDSSLKLFSRQKKQVAELKMQGFPFFHDGKKFLMLPGGVSFAFLDDNFSPKWKFENYAPITAFDCGQDSVAAGYADGSILIFDGEGTLRRQYEPGGSTFPVILGLAVSEDGNTTASVSGRQKQRFTLARQENGLTKIVFHEYLKEETTRQVLVSFSKDENYCYFAHKDCLGILDCRSLKASHISIKGNILSIQETEDGKNTFVLSKNGGRYSVSVIQNHSCFCGSFDFSSENAFITVSGKSLFVGRDNLLSRIDLEFK